MKKIFLSLAIASLTFASCGGDKSEDKKAGENTGENTETVVTTEEMQSVNLEENELPVTMDVPKYFATGMKDPIPYEVIHDEGDYKWKIVIGKEEKIKYCLTIEDMGDETADLVADKKSQLAGDRIWNINYIVDGSNAILMEKTLAGDDSVDPQYQVFGTFTADGIKYKVYSDETEAFKKRHAQNMLASIQSLNKKPA